MMNFVRTFLFATAASAVYVMKKKRVVEKEVYIKVRHVWVGQDARGNGKDFDESLIIQVEASHTIASIKRRVHAEWGMRAGPYLQGKKIQT